jgi:hypothetical protein
MRIRRRVRLLAFADVVCSMALAACSSSGTPANAVTGTPRSTPTRTTSPGSVFPQDPLDNIYPENWYFVK